MASYETKTMFDCTVEKAFELVATVEKQMEWRTDLKEVEVISPRQFIEHTKDGYSTYYTVTKMGYNQYWQRTFENENLEGFSLYTFIPKGNKTQFVMTEKARTSKLLMKPYVRNFLKGHQYHYIHNLKEAIGQKID